VNAVLSQREKMDGLRAADARLASIKRLVFLETVSP
jgi:hypothetical protein